MYVYGCGTNDVLFPENMMRSHKSKYCDLQGAKKNLHKMGLPKFILQLQVVRIETEPTYLQFLFKEKIKQ